MSQMLALASALVRTLDRKLNVLTVSEEVYAQLDESVNQLALAVSDRDDARIGMLTNQIKKQVDWIDQDMKMLQCFVEEFTATT